MYEYHLEFILKLEPVQMALDNIWPLFIYLIYVSSNQGTRKIINMKRGPFDDAMACKTRYAVCRDDKRLGT